MAASVPDSLPIRLEEPVSTRNTVGLQTGLFYADADVLIANRLAARIRNHGCKVSPFDFCVGGELKLQEIENFIQSKRLVLWLATLTSLNDKEILRAARHMAQYASIARPDLNVRFVVLQPHEHLNARLPLSLDAYTSLREDEMFETRLQTTVGSICKSLTEKGIPFAQQSTASAAAVSDERGDRYRSVVPNSDIMMENIAYDGDGNIDLRSSPEKQTWMTGDNAEAATCAKTGADNPQGGPVSFNTYHLHIHGEKNAIQVGNDSVMNVDAVPRETRRSLPPERPGYDNNKDGTPV